ncbi:xanthine dehydrogenase small subunit [Sneathiella limimaris]|uniref:xanthine dehydrogenase small subunit n=1 Tax=Sneathiella limimaris TaxID=1964213 RepID=UPI00146C049E|nr:xanthine dehydrogenase small subunit [Sneathiella limimaris]
MRDTIRFVYNGQIQELKDWDPTATLLNYLRYEKALTGSKEGCAEGDCGACSVVLGELKDGTVRYQAVNACIQFLPMLDGKELITVESLKSADGHVHPVQQAMVDANATQCGFCTPGFVMSLFAEHQGENRSDTQSLNDVLAGNLCRCTGYGTIIDAAKKASTQANSDHLATRSKLTAELLSTLADEEMLGIDRGDKKYFAPNSKAELAGLLKKYPDATLLAGATDVGLWVTKLHKELPILISVGKVADMQSVEDQGDTILISAGVTYSDAWPALKNLSPDMGELIRRVASTQIRNSGTIGGNIANGSPIGDTPPALIALGATLHLQSEDGIRSLPLEDFFIEYGKQDLAAGEFVAAVEIPKLHPNHQFRTYKISKRFDQDISALCGAFRLTLDGNVIDEIRICFGGMAGTPLRAGKTEAFLKGKAWTLEVIEQAVLMLSEDYTPLSDMRASQSYRMQAAQNLLRKFHLETTSPDIETRLVGEGSIAHA